MKQLQNDLVAYEAILHASKSITWPIATGQVKGYQFKVVSEFVHNDTHVLHLMMTRKFLRPSRSIRGIPPGIHEKVRRKCGGMEIVISTPINLSSLCKSAAPK